MLYDDLYLEHHGIKGQRWGVRRYQNDDGSLTALGQKRFRKDIDAIKKKQDKIDNKNISLSKKQFAKDKIKRRFVNANNRNITFIRAKTQGENKELLNEIVNRKAYAESILRQANKMPFKEYMALLDNPETTSALKAWTDSVRKYNDAQRNNVNIFMGDLGSEKMPNSDQTYSEYVDSLIRYSTRLSFTR